LSQLPPLAFSTDHGGIHPPGEALGPGHHPDQPVRLHGLGLALEGHGLDPLRFHGIPDEAVSRRAYQDLPRPGRLLETGGHVHGVPRHQGLPGDQLSGQDFPGVDAGADLERHSRVEGQVLIHLPQGVAHVCCRPHRSERVVLVESRDAEHGHHRVADELLHPAAVAFEHPAHPLEVPGHHGAKGFRIELLPHAGKAGYVREHYGHGLSDLPGRLDGRGQGRAAETTEPETLGILFPALRAQHG
jgi:hypothetical protein